MLTPILLLFLSVFFAGLGSTGTAMFHRAACPWCRRAGQVALLTCLLAAGLVTLSSILMHHASWWFPAIAMSILATGVAFDGRREFAAEL